MREIATAKRVCPTYGLDIFECGNGRLRRRVVAPAAADADDGAPGPRLDIRFASTRALLLI